jgi:hypothetical protein
MYKLCSGVFLGHEVLKMNERILKILIQSSLQHLIRLKNTFRPPKGDKNDEILPYQ